MTKATYVTISTLNPDNGWDVWDIGPSGWLVDRIASMKIGPIVDSEGNRSLERETLQTNLRTVSKTEAKKVYKIDIDNYVLDENLMYVDIRYEG